MASPLAEFESSCGSISVGGFASDVGLLQPPALAVQHSALGKLVELARRRAGLGVDDLAKRLGLELHELIVLERGGVATMAADVVQRLCDALRLPKAGVLALAGFDTGGSGPLEDASLRFATRASAKLSPEEERALDEFVKDLARAPE